MDVHNTPSHELVGQTFTGAKAGRSWKVKEKVTLPKGGSGGTFSVGYVAIDQAGEEHFLKATDIGLLRIDGNKSRLDQMREALYNQRYGSYRACCGLW